MAGRVSLQGARYWLSRLLISLAFALPGAAQAEDLSAQVQIQRGALVFNRISHTLDTRVTVTNRSADTLMGPLRLLLVDAQPAQVALYNSAGRNAAGQAYLLLPLQQGLLAPGASVTAIVRLLNYGHPVLATQFRVEGERLTAANSSLIRLQGRFVAGEKGPQEQAVGAGFKVRVDGLLRGVTDAQGRFSLRVPLEAQHISLELAPNHFGDAPLPPRSAGANQAVTVLVDGGKEIGQDSRLRLDALQQGLLPPTAASIVLRFLKDEQFVRLAHVDWVHLIAADGSLRRLDRLFSLQADGSLLAQGPAFRQAIAGKGNRLRLDVSAGDTLGQVHTDALDFVPAQHRVRLQLLAPPSNPGLSLAGLRVRVEVPDVDLRLQTQTDARGLVTLPELPAGKLALQVSTQAGGLVYSGAGEVELAQHSLVSLVMRAPQDVPDGVRPIWAEPLATPKPATTETR